MFYNGIAMDIGNIPDFYTGTPVDSDDLKFREEFLGDLWETLAAKHVLLTAPRRTGKTSVMDHLKHRPKDGFTVVAVNAQDISHPADLFQAILDTFLDNHPKFFRDKLASGWELVKAALGKIGEVNVGGFKIALRESDPAWRNNWRQHGTDFLQRIREHDQRVLLVIDELPDMLLNLQQEDKKLLREFLAWWRSQRLEPHPKNDVVRWLIGGSVNLKGTLDSLGIVDLINDLEDVTLPPLTEAQVIEFVREMLSARAVKFDDSLPARMVERLGRPIPLFMQMATQDLYRRWKRRPGGGDMANQPFTADDVDQIFDDLVKSSAAQDKLQHYYSRIARYYTEPRLSAAYELLAKISLTSDGLSRDVLSQEFDRVSQQTGLELPAHERKRQFNQMLRDLENDFYVAEVAGDQYDFASGVLKSWWKKYYA
jgi:Cdc6-like AAA superfamily ATPase